MKHIINFLQHHTCYQFFPRAHTNHIIIRFMHRVGTQFMDLGKNQMSNVVRASVPRRHYPGKYLASRIRPSLTDNEKQRLGITQHEAKHLNLIDQKTDKVEGILTSAQNKAKTAAGGYFCKIDPVKVNGTYTPKIDPNTKKPVLDANGNTVQNPNKGGQWMAVFDKPRIVSKDVKHLYETDIEAQAYVDQHENTIKAHIDKSRTQHSRNLPKQIGGQDDEPLS